MRAVLDLASRLHDVQEPGGAPWPGHEYVRGWGVFGHPFDSGHALMPQRMYFIEESEATPEGIDLGRPTRCEPNPSIGGVPLPARGILAIGQAAWEILDPAEYDRTRNFAL
jgi:hypothetical protein